MRNVYSRSFALFVFIVLSGCSTSDKQAEGYSNGITSTAGINYPECSSYTPYKQFNDVFTNRMQLSFVTPGSKQMVDNILSYSNEDFVYVDLLGNYGASGCQPATSSVLTVGQGGVQVTVNFTNTYNGNQLVKQKSDTVRYDYTYYTGNVPTEGMIKKITKDDVDCYDFTYDGNIGTLTQLDISQSCSPENIPMRWELTYANPAGTDPYLWSWYENKNGTWEKTIYQEWTVIREANIIQSISVTATDLSLNQTDTMTMKPSYKNSVLENIFVEEVFNQMDDQYYLEFENTSSHWKFIDHDEAVFKNEVKFSDNQVGGSTWSNLYGSGSTTYTY